MSVKKIEGYTIFLKERLGEGSFGSVRNFLFRFTRRKKKKPRNHLLLRLLTKNK